MNTLKDLFYKRTEEHIRRVQINALKLYNYSSMFKHLPEQAKRHDESKYKTPEFLPYVILTHYYRCKQEGIELKTPAHITDHIKKAVFHHLKCNSHHPEFWDNSVKPLNKGERSAIVNALKMPIIDIAEMVCDWKAMSQELGNSAEDFANSVVNKRFTFNSEQKTLIYELLKVLKEKNYNG